MCLINRQRVEDACDITGLIFQAVADVEGLAAVTMPRQIDRIDIEVVGQVAGQTGPVVLVGPEAMDHDDGVACAHFLVPEIGDVKVAHCHARRLQTRR